MRNHPHVVSEDVLLLPPLPMTPAPDIVLEVPIHHKHFQWLQDKAKELQSTADKMNLKLRQKLTPEDLVRVLVHLYVCTGGWTDLLSIPDPDEPSST